MAATIEQARNAIQQYLQQMNHYPSSLTISSFDTEDSPWKIEGEFQSGFLGERYSYEANFDPFSHLIKKMKILSLPNKQDYA